MVSIGFFKAVDAGSHLSPTDLPSSMFQKAFTYTQIVLKAGKEGESRELYTNCTYELKLVDSIRNDNNDKSSCPSSPRSVTGASTSHGPRLLLQLRCDAPPPPPPADSAPPTLPSTLPLPLRLPPLPGRADDADSDVACVAGGRDCDWPRACKESPGRAPRAPMASGAGSECCVDVDVTEMSHACF
ncbi:hypothetical protein BC827DRAFT_1226028 [Russula dissimulans]|nr:hypothetical protein BC827DRAFT_1226028 [Russula dissimulans]